MDRARTPRAARRTLLLCAPLFVFAVFAGARAQTPPPPPRPVTSQPGRESRTSTMRMELPTPMAETPVPFDGGRGLQPLSFVTPDTSFDEKLVKNAPFTAEATTESIQTLGDGNRMVRKSSARLFRDAAGRTRREHTLDRRGARDGDGEEPKLIVINDPVAQVNYLIETERKTVRRTEMPPGLAEARRRAFGGDDASFGVLMPTNAAHRRAAEGDNAPAPPKPKKEKLDSQMIEGVLAEGTRITVTIPAGEFDNEQPLEITHEQWYSPELQMVVMMKHNDPRFGVTEFRLTNISRGEPDRTLFEPPQGYKTISPREPFPFPGRPRPGGGQ
jgi:hypothetical protein